MFEQEKPHYCSRGVAEEIPTELQMFLGMILEQQKEQHKMAHMQVFRLQVGEDGTLYIQYSQEQPNCQESYALILVDADLPNVDGKTIYVIDDGTQVTMFFPEEW